MMLENRRFFYVWRFESNDEMFIYIVATIILASIASINVKIFRLNFAIFIRSLIMVILITCVVSFVFQVSHSHAISQSVPRVSQVSSHNQIESRRNIFSRSNIKNMRVAWIFSLVFFSTRKGKKKTLFINTATMPADSRYMRRGLVRYVWGVLM